MVQDTGNRLILAFLKQTERIEYFCSSENISPNVSVHEIRKSFKRMRALLKFYIETPENYAEKYNSEIKAAGKILSPIRESYVNIQVFERITEVDSHIPERKTKQAREHLLEKNRALIENGYFGNNLSENILQFVKSFDELPEKAGIDIPTISQMEKQISEGFAESYNFFQRIDQDTNPENMHELRKSLKSLWYQLDFIKFMHPRYFRMKSDQLNKITEQLGEDHDLAVFMEEINQEEYDFSEEEIMILENQVEHQRELNLLKLSPRLRQFFNESPEMFNRKLEKIFRIL